MRFLFSNIKKRKTRSYSILYCSCHFEQSLVTGICLKLFRVEEVQEVWSLEKNTSFTMNMPYF